MSDTKPLLIGLVGNAHHGKSTVADFLKTAGFTEYAFADPLKQTVMCIFGFSHAQCYDQKLKEVVDPYWKISPRQALIAVGEHNAEKLKEIEPSLDLGEFNRLWVRRFERHFEEQKWGSQNIVVSDIRHENEARSIKKLGGYILRVYNPRLIGANESFRKSESEQRVTSIRYDGALINNGSLKDLDAVTMKMYSDILNGKPNSNYAAYTDLSKKLDITIWSAE